MIFEGGQAGHMAHPFDYTDFTANDLIDLVDSLFKGKIENLKEKGIEAKTVLRYL